VARGAGPHLPQEAPNRILFAGICSRDRASILCHFCQHAIIDEKKSRAFEMGQFRQHRVDPLVALFQVWHHVAVVLATIALTHNEFLYHN
jgi:hypothetical protein